MTSPEFDKDGYPTEATLEAITKWDWTDPFGLARFVMDAWNWPDYAKLVPVPAEEAYNDGEMDLTLATGGWSGNEDIIRAMEKNRMFMAMYWYMSKRGGLTVFRIHEPPKGWC